MSSAKLVYWVQGLSCCNSRWEAAYRRFESKEAEIAKFKRRLNRLGASAWPREMRILDLFCGSGSNLVCLEALGFSRLSGVDLSPELLKQYSGSQAQLFVGDATDLKFQDHSFDRVIIQGVLHHLPHLPDDLDACLREIHRVLSPSGQLVLVEPCLTPFLRSVHWCGHSKLLRRIWGKLDALQTMIEEEIVTYEQWLSQPALIEETVTRYFDARINQKAWGKWAFVGSVKPSNIDHA
jgi:ubiquinone/menaquinone biosynthesis C-methylase UbiE